MVQVIRRLRAALTALSKSLTDDDRAGAVRSYLKHLRSHHRAVPARYAGPSRSAGNRPPTLLMIAMTLVNHAVVMLGLKTIRTARFTPDSGIRSARDTNFENLVGDDLLGVAGPDPRLHHRCRIDIDLDRGATSCEDVALEIRGNADHEGISAFVHRGHDVPFGDELWPLEQRRQERGRDPTREFGVIFVDDGDRSVVKFL